VTTTTGGGREKTGKNKGRREPNLSLQNKTRTLCHCTKRSFFYDTWYQSFIEKYLVFKFEQKI